MCITRQKKDKKKSEEEDPQSIAPLPGNKLHQIVKGRRSTPRAKINKTNRLVVVLVRTAMNPSQNPRRNTVSTEAFESHRNQGDPHS